jgi:predicted DNA-binding WGR domain protein
MITRTFELTEGKSDKFWTITVAGKRHTVNFGRRGTAGQTQTKEFADGAAAMRASEKLVAEKLKKGYIEVGVARAAPTAPPQAAPKPAPAVAPVASPLAGASDAIRLQPAEWMTATWRPHIARPKPPAAAFDKPAALASIRDWVAGYQKFYWRWKAGRLLTLPPAMSEEEARFWFNAIRVLMRWFYGEVPETGESAGDWRKLKRVNFDVVKQIGEFDCSSPLPLESAAAMLRKTRLTSLMLIPLLNLFPVRDLLGAVVEASAEASWSEIGDNCFCSAVLPYLSDEDRQAAGDAVRKNLPAQTWPTDRYEHPAFVFRLASLFGGGEELKQIVAAWPDAF